MFQSQSPLECFTVKDEESLWEGIQKWQRSREKELGRITANGVKWRGAIFYRTASGKLSFLNNTVGLFEAEVDEDGNFTEKICEWK